MRNHRRMLPLILVALGVAAAAMTLRPQSPAAKPQDGQKKFDKAEFESQFPVVDYDAPEPADPGKHARRQRSKKKFGAVIGDINENTDLIFSTRDWETGLPALPVEKSQAIITGVVLKAEGQLNADKSGVYSEFTIHIKEVLKNDRQVPIEADGVVVAEREGGRVRLPSGRMALSYTNGQGMPRAGRLYLLFLTHDFPFGGAQQDDFYILTGYELSAGRVVPLDSPGGGRHPIATLYKGADVSTLMNDLRSALPTPGK